MIFWRSSDFSMRGHFLHVGFQRKIQALKNYVKIGTTINSVKLRWAAKGHQCFSSWWPWAGWQQSEAFSSSDRSQSHLLHAHKSIPLEASQTLKIFFCTMFCFILAEPKCKGNKSYLKNQEKVSVIDKNYYWFSYYLIIHLLYLGASQVAPW